MGKFKWSLLHDIGNVYFVFGVMAQSKEKVRQVRIDKIREKFLEWPSEENNNEKILKEVMQTIGKDMEDSIDTVLKRVQSSISNIVENLSEDNIRAIIDDLLSIVNAASPSDVEINQINSMAEQMGVKPLTKQKAKGKSEQSSTDDAPWTLLHDMCYLYYLVASLPLLQGSKDVKNVKLRIDAAKEKMSEWPCDDVDSDLLVQKVSNLVINDLKRWDLKVKDKLNELATKIKKYMPKENYPSVLEDLAYIINTWSPNRSYDEQAVSYIAHVIGNDDESSKENNGETSSNKKSAYTSNDAKRKKEKKEEEKDSKNQSADGNALIWAIMEGYTQSVRMLIDQGADINAADFQGMTALLWAASKGQTEIVELLISKGADIEAKSNKGNNALIGASVYGYIETVKLLLDKGADIEAVNNDGWTVLMNAASAGQTEIVELLIDKGADIEAKNDNGWNALMYAAGGGYTKTVALLLDKGADIEAKDIGGQTALVWAEKNGHEETGKYIKKFAAEHRVINLIKSGNVLSGLVGAVSGGNLDEVKQMIREGNIDLDDRQGVDQYTAVHYAAWDGRDEILKILLKAGAKPDLVGSDGYSPLILAACNGRTGCVKILLGAGVDTERRKNDEWYDGTDGGTALRGALWQQNWDIVDLLIESGADITNLAEPCQSSPSGGKVSLFEAIRLYSKDKEFHPNEEYQTQYNEKRLNELESRVKNSLKGEKIVAKEDKKPSVTLQGKSEATTQAKEVSIPAPGDEPYRKKVKEALADGVITDLERTGLDFFQKKLNLSDDDTLRIFEEVLAEIQGKPEGRAVKTRIDGAKTAAVEESMPEETGEEDDGEVKSSKKRITYANWEEFEKEQGAKDERKKNNLPIAGRIHELIVTVLGENDKKFEIRYGDGTFSFSMPREEARSGKRTFARVGLLSVADKSIYLDTLYKEENDAIPPGGVPWRKSDPTQYVFRFKTLEDFEKVKDSIKQGVIRSYFYLAK